MNFTSKDIEKSLMDGTIIKTNKASSSMDSIMRALAELLNRKPADIKLPDINPNVIVNHKTVTKWNFSLTKDKEGNTTNIVATALEFN